MQRMTLDSKLHRAISIAAISLISFVGLETLVYINNLYQIETYIFVSGFIYIFLVLWLHFIFDLHFKDREHLSAKTLAHSIYRRFKHFLSWERLRYFENFMILPGLLYWGSIILIGINFGHLKLQHFIAVISAAALVCSFTLFKEIFHQKDFPVKNTHFIILTYVKIYASWLVYAGSLGIVWYYCLPAWVFYAVIFLVTVMLLYQALFQFAAISLKTIGFALLAAAAISLVSFFVYREWNVNYFSAGLFLTACYNLLWNYFYHAVKKSLSLRIFAEQLAIFLMLVVMVFGVTNFNAKIDRCSF